MDKDAFECYLSIMFGDFISYSDFMYQVIKEYGELQRQMNLISCNKSMLAHRGQDVLRRFIYNDDRFKYLSVILECLQEQEQTLNEMPEELKLRVLLDAVYQKLH